MYLPSYLYFSVSPTVFDICSKPYSRVAGSKLFDQPSEQGEPCNLQQENVEIDKSDKSAERFRKSGDELYISRINKDLVHKIYTALLMVMETAYYIHYCILWVLALAIE